MTSCSMLQLHMPAVISSVLSPNADIRLCQQCLNDGFVLCASKELNSINSDAGAAGEGQGMMVEGMWPYWLDGHAPTTVKNSFHMSSMYLLTGMLLPCCGSMHGQISCMLQVFYTTCRSHTFLS